MGEGNTSGRMTPSEELRERRAQMIDTLSRAEQEARMPEDAARYRGMRRMVEQNEREQN